MRGKKIVFADYDLHDRTGVQEFLDKQASKGWQLEFVRAGCWHFTKRSSETLSYSIAFFAKFNSQDSESDPERQNFVDFCARNGWRWVCNKGPMHIFLTTEKDVQPLETDPAVEIATIHKAVRKSYGAEVFLAVSFGLSFIMRFAMLVLSLKRGNYADIQVDLVLALVPLLICLGFLIRVTSYYSWHKKAKKALVVGAGFYPTRSYTWTSWVQLAAWIAMMACFLPDEFPAILFLVWALVLGILTIIAMHLWHRPAVKTDENCVRSSEYGVLVGFLLCMIGIAFLIVLPMILAIVAAAT